MSSADTSTDGEGDGERPDRDGDDWELPTDQELAEFFSQPTAEADPWCEYFGYGDAPARQQRKLDDRVREFLRDHGA